MENAGENYTEVAIKVEFNLCMQIVGDFQVDCSYFAGRCVPDNHCMGLQFRLFIHGVLSPKVFIPKDGQSQCPDCSRMELSVIRETKMFNSL